MCTRILGREGDFDSLCVDFPAICLILPRPGQQIRENGRQITFSPSTAREIALWRPQRWAMPRSGIASGSGGGPGFLCAHARARGKNDENPALAWFLTIWRPPRQKFFQIYFFGSRRLNFFLSNLPRAHFGDDSFTQDIFIRQ